MSSGTSPAVTSIATVGAYARVQVEIAGEVRERLADLPGVTVFDLDEPAKVGLIVESLDLQAAHVIVTKEITRVEGVLGVWPIYAHFEEQ